MDEQRPLQVFRNFVNQLRDRLGGVRAPTDLNRFRLVLELVRQRLDLPGERRGKQKRLPFLRQRLDNLPDGRKKAHVEHPVRLIENQK